MNSEVFDRIREVYKEIKPHIEDRLSEFNDFLNETDNDEIFAELAFCILTPQSKAKTCWKAIEFLKGNRTLYEGVLYEIRAGLSGVRFQNNKSSYIVEARNTVYEINNVKHFLEDFDCINNLREWIIDNFKGIGIKEASHFLRNIGMGEKLAILDRHILKNLKKLDVIKKIPENLTKEKYIRIENKMKKFSDETDIPMSHLDLLLWYMEAGEIFK